MFQHLSVATQAASSPDLSAAWRWTVYGVGVGAILLTIGLFAIGIFLFRKRATDRTLLYFGIFVVIYAVRIFLRDSALTSLFAMPPAFAYHVIRAITFTLGLPPLLLFLEVVQARWRRVILWALGVQIVFTCFALPLDFFGIAHRAIDITNSLLLLASWILLIVFLFFFRPLGRLSRELRIVGVGFVVFSLFVLHANLVGLGLIRGSDVEPVGFLFFVCTLGYFVAHRIFAREESLFAIQKELEIAEQIQSSILPRDVPRHGGIEIAARYLPMSAVAGDFYDFLPLEDNQLGVLIADVTGHGVPAALIASMLKVAFAGQTAHAQDPARVLTGLNQALCGKFEDHFVTAAYLFFDLDRRLVRYAGAGHPPLLSFSASSGEARAIEQNGLFLGMFPEAVYSSIEIPLRTGDRYLLYTDGLPESKNSTDEEFGIMRCKSFLKSHLHLGSAAFADELLLGIARWSARDSGTLQEDDMTLVVLDLTAA
jgi:sigma-B regulation protein RsbU (phosphoserine phosphatase)